MHYDHIFISYLKLLTLGDVIIGRAVASVGIVEKGRRHGGDRDKSARSAQKFAFS